MHNIDRTQSEYGLQEFAPEYLEGEFAPEAYEGEIFPEIPLFETPYQGTAAFEGEAHEIPLGEGEIMELAAQFLEITNEEELNHFLGGLFRRVGRAVGKVIRSPIGRALGGVLRGVARKALPAAGAALGGMVGGPAGAALGGKVAAGAGQAFGLETEGLSPEDRDFEVARRFVKFAANATRRAAAALPTVDPVMAARSAVMTAARRYAPGILRWATAAGVPYPCTCGAAAAAPPVDTDQGYEMGAVPGIPGAGRMSGRWVRHGGRIVLFGVR